jgi:N-acetylmuramoyl-L-alanine amidase
MSHKVYLAHSLQIHNPYTKPPGGVEYDHMRPIALAAASLLRTRGVETKLPDPAWRFLADYAYLDRMANAADAWGANAYVAAHSNAAGSSARGALTLYFPPSSKSKGLAICVEKHVAAISPFTRDGVADIRGDASLHDLRTPKAPAALTEVGFHTNRADAEHIAAHPDLYGRAIADAVCEFLGVKIVVPKPATVLVERLSPSMYVRLMAFLGNPARRPAGTTQVRILSTVWARFMAAIRNRKA